MTSWCRQRRGAKVSAHLEPGGRAVVLDAVVERGGASDPAKLLDLPMMLLPEGRQRSREEFAAPVEAVGPRLAGLRPAGLRPILSGPGGARGFGPSRRG